MTRKEEVMFERINAPEEACSHKLGAALAMERAVQEILKGGRSADQPSIRRR